MKVLRAECQWRLPPLTSNPIVASLVNVCYLARLAATENIAEIPVERAMPLQLRSFFSLLLKLARLALLAL